MRKNCSAIVTLRGSGLGYWVEYVEDSDVLDIMQMFGEVWQSYSSVFGVFPNNQAPPVPHNTLYVGNVYTLIEFSAPPSRLSAPPL